MKIIVVFLIAFILSLGMYAGTEVVWPHHVEARPGCQQCP
jgi:hypothetical protein